MNKMNTNEKSVLCEMKMERKKPRTQIGIANKMRRAKATEKKKNYHQKLNILNRKATEEPKTEATTRKQLQLQQQKQ